MVYFSQTRTSESVLSTGCILADGCRFSCCLLAGIISLARFCSSTKNDARAATLTVAP